MINLIYDICFETLVDRYLQCVLKQIYLEIEMIQSSELCPSILNHPLICMRDNCYGKAYIVYYIIVSLTREVLPHKMNGYLTSYISYLMVLMRGNQLSLWYSTVLFFHVPVSLFLMSLLKLNGMSNDSFIDSLILMLCTVCSNMNYFYKI